MDAAATTEPAKKRGRPKKVVEEAGVPGEGKGAGGVRKASTKAVGKKEGGGKKTGRAAAAATTVKTTAAKAKVSGAKAKSAVEKVGDKVASAAKMDKGTPKAPESSRILEEVFATGTLKRPGTEGVQMKESGGGDGAKVEMQEMSPPPDAQAEPSTPTPTPTVSKPTPTPTSVPHPTTPPASAPPIQSFKPTPTPRIPTPTTPTPPQPQPQPPLRHPRISTIPLPLHPQNPPTHSHSNTHPTTPRPQLTREEIAQLELEERIRTGKMPNKYKPAARRVTAIMVALPLGIVSCWELYKQWRKEIDARHEARRLKEAAKLSEPS